MKDFYNPISYYNFKPTPKQKLFLDNPAKNKLFGGSMGGGKSIVLCANVIHLAVKYPYNRVLIARKEYAAFKKSTMVDLLDMIPSELILDHNKTDGEITLINKSKILMTGLENREKIKSLNLGAFAIDEASQVEFDIVAMLMSRTRLAIVPENERRHLFASNPEPCWLKDKFVDPYMKGELDPDYAYIPSLPHENPYLSEKYIDNLRKTFPPLWVAKYLEGSWDVFEAQIFKPDFIQKTIGSPKYISFIMAVDPAITETDDEKADETAICVVGITADNQIHEVECRHGRWSFETSVQNCVEMYNFYKPDFFGVEKVAYQAALQQVLNSRNIPAIPLKADGDKTRRAYSIQHMLENKQVFVNNETLIKQMLEFPESAKHGGHDDLVDSFVYCLIMIKKFSMDENAPIQPSKYKNLEQWEIQFWDNHHKQINQNNNMSTYQKIMENYK